MSNALQKPKGQYRKVFFLGLVVAAIIFIPFQVLDKGYFFFFGDFNVQQIPFYTLAHEAVRSGNLGWSWTTDLGANFVSSYSFYLLGSPFFWLTLPFPTAFVPHLMAPLFCLKFATATLTSYIYLARFLKNKDLAVLGALLYAFSGFSIYNIFFNHFHECIAFFPLLLIGLEEVMTRERKGLFAFAVLLNAMVNYFFFVGEVVFLIIYFVAKLSTGEFKLTATKFKILALESVVGFAMSAFLLVPSIIGILSNPRLDNRLEGWDVIIYQNVQRYLQIVQSFFFPPELPSRPNFLPDANTKWASVAGWLPLFGMSGAIAYLQSTKKNFIRRVLAISAIFAFVPILNSVFYAFNNAYYARWFYMPVLLLALATVKAFETQGVDLMRGLRWNAAIVLAFVIGIGLVPNKQTDGTTKLGLEAFPDRFWGYSIVVLVGLAVCYYLYRYAIKKENFASIFQGVSIFFIILTATAFIALGKGHSFSTEYIIDTAIKGRDNWTYLEENNKDQFYRVDVFKGMDNQAMFWHMPTIQAFQSIVPGSIMEFYPAIGIQRDVGSRPEISHRALRNLVSVKYLFAFSQGDEFSSPAFTFLGSENGFDIYENDNYVPMGFTYTDYITESQFQAATAEGRDKLLVKAILLTEAQENKYRPLLSQLSFTDPGVIDDAQMAADAAARRESAAYFFQTNNSGFTAKIDLPQDNLVFFSVPYEEGWSAKVDGRPVTIEKVSHGMMAVLTPAGDHEIIFTYQTPGLMLGIFITIGSVAVFLLYLLLARMGGSLAPLPEPLEEMDLPPVLAATEQPPLLADGESAQTPAEEIPRNAIDYYHLMEEQIEGSPLESDELASSKPNQNPPPSPDLPIGGTPTPPQEEQSASPSVTEEPPAQPPIVLWPRGNTADTEQLPPVGDNEDDVSQGIDSPGPAPLFQSKEEQKNQQSEEIGQEALPNLPSNEGSPSPVVAQEDSQPSKRLSPTVDATQVLAVTEEIGQIQQEDFGVKLAAPPGKKRPRPKSAQPVPPSLRGAAALKQEPSPQKTMENQPKPAAAPPENPPASEKPEEPVKNKYVDVLQSMQGSMDEFREKSQKDGGQEG